MQQFREFRIGDLFEVNTGSLISSNKLKTGKVPRVSAKSDNNGIIGYYDTDNISEARNFENFISVNFFGTEGGIFYHPYKATVEMKVHVLTIKNVIFNRNIALYLTAALRPSLSKKFGYGSQLSSSLLKDGQFNIKLPVNSKNNIDYEYMESYISQTENRHIADLEKHLIVTNLIDYKLNSKDKKVISLKPQWRKFRLSDIFNWQSQKEINPLHLKMLSISEEKKYPFYGQALLNNGIITYCELQEGVLNNKDGKPTILIHSNNQNTVYLETPFYLKDGHGATSVLQADFLNKLNALYMITSIKKVISKRFSYNAKATKIGLKNTEIQLPVNSDGILDFSYMESYIKAHQKLAITNMIQISELKITPQK